MNNFERVEEAQTLADTLTPFALASEVGELKQKVLELETELDDVYSTLDRYGIDLADFPEESEND